MQLHRNMQFIVILLQYVKHTKTESIGVYTVQDVNISNITVLNEL